MSKCCPSGKAWALALGLGAVVAFSQPSLARIGGLEDLPGGGTFGSSADNIPVGVVMVDQFFVQVGRNDIGPGAPFKILKLLVATHQTRPLLSASRFSSSIQGGNF